MGVQTQVFLDFNPAVEGGVRNARMTRSRVAEVALNNGLLVSQGANDAGCKLPTSAADVGKAIGIAPYRPTSTVGFPSTQTTEYAQGDNVGAVSQGQVWVRVEEAVAPFSPVYVRFAIDTGGSFTNVGTFRASPDPVGGVATAALLPNAAYLTTAAAGQLALVEINLP